jgi:5-phospho-D-xylono-1,4-lactonase
VIVRTVLGDVPPERLGLTLGHEHLIANPGAAVDDDDLRLDDEDAAVRELGTFRAVGGGAVVEMTTVDYGRDVAALRRVSRRSAVHVIASTGFNKGRFADPIVSRYDDDELIAWLIDEVQLEAAPYAPPDRFRLPIGRREATSASSPVEPPVRAGVIKASTGALGPGPQERRVLDAAVAAHRATGAPVGTHTERADWALEQARHLVDGGVLASKVLIGHCDFRPDPAYLLEVAATGVHLGLDQFGKHKYLPDEERVRLVAHLASEGRLAQVILSGDLARRSYWPAYQAGATGFAHIPRTVIGMLRAEGLGDADVDQVLRENPRRWLSFEPRRLQGERAAPR